VVGLTSELTAIFDALVWAPRHMIFDDPNEITTHMVVSLCLPVGFGNPVVELYELRSDPAVKKRVFSLSGSARATLHCEAYVFDRRDVFIGSLNLGPRSGDINTEAGLYFESPELAVQVIAYMEEGVWPENSYRVQLDANGDLYWVTETDGKAERYDHAPTARPGSASRCASSGCCRS